MTDKLMRVSYLVAHSALMRMEYMVLEAALRIILFWRAARAALGEKE